MSPPTDALTVTRFSITADGRELGTFSELLGITSSIEAVDVVQPSGTEVLLKKLPGKRTPPTVVLKRGMSGSLELWDWQQAVLTGDMAARKSCSLVMFNVEGRPVARYHLENAWPAKLEVGSLKAGASEVLMESVTLECERIQRLAPTD